MLLDENHLNKTIEIYWNTMKKEINKKSHLATPLIRNNFKIQNSSEVYISCQFSNLWLSKLVVSQLFHCSPNKFLKTELRNKTHFNFKFNFIMYIERNKNVYLSNDIQNS